MKHQNTKSFFEKHKKIIEVVAATFEKHNCNVHEEHLPIGYLPHRIGRRNHVVAWISRHHARELLPPMQVGLEELGEGAHPTARRSNSFVEEE